VEDPLTIADEAAAHLVGHDAAEKAAQVLAKLLGDFLKQEIVPLAISWNIAVDDVFTPSDRSEPTSLFGTVARWLRQFADELEEGDGS
jgi:hypothetical protein